jgi:hypothetical protein
MEVNGRFWGSLQLAIAAGVDLPRLWIEVLSGREIAPVGSYAEGVTVRWLWGDVKRFFSVVSGRPPGYTDRFPTRWEGLAELFGRQPEGTLLEAWDPNDPWPALGEWVQGLGDLGSPATIRRGARRVVSPWRARLQGVAARERGVVAPQPESVPGAPSQHL